MSENKSNSQKVNAEPSSAPGKGGDAAAQVVKPKIFILKAKSKSLKNAEQFLKNRDFEVISTTDMKVAISTILSGQASVIMLSTDHQNPKVMRLPQIIQQGFNTPIIIFSEGASQRGTAALREAQHSYILYPPVSGPAVERMILKIERDKKEKADGHSQSKDKLTNETDQNQSTMKFSGHSSNGADEIIMQRKKAEQEFAKIFANEGSPDSNSSSSDLAGEYGQDEGAFSQNVQNAYDQGDSHDDASSVRDYLNQENGGFNSNSGLQSSTHVDSDADESASPATGLGLPKFIGMNKKGDTYIAPQNEPKSSGHPSSLALAKNANDRVAPDFWPAAQAELSETEILARKGVNLLTFKSEDNASFLIKGTQHAIENSAKFIQGKRVSKIQTCAKVSCFSIEANKFSGFVIVAFADNDKVDEQFNKNIKGYLSEYLKVNGLEVEVSDFQFLKIKEVNFEEWSVREADFLMTSIHEGSEIALAFFPKEKAEAPLELSAQANMARMTIDEIKADEPIEFDVYIYLPANKKYVRYTSRNGIMYSGQKDRLKTGGHDKIHIRKESESDLSRYRVQNFLNEKIEGFKRSKKSA